MPHAKSSARLGKNSGGPFQHFVTGFPNRSRRTTDSNRVTLLLARCRSWGGRRDALRSEVRGRDTKILSNQDSRHILLAPDMPTLSIRNIAGFAHVLSNPRCNEEAGPVGTRQQFAHIRRPSAPKITAFRQYPTPLSHSQCAKLADCSSKERYRFYKSGCSDLSSCFRRK